MAELVVQFAELEGFGLLVALRFVDRHVEDAEVELAEVEERVVDVLGLDEGLDQLVRDFLLGFGGVRAGLFAPCGFVFGGEGGVVLAQGFELGGSPAPVFEHLRGGFDEVADYVCAVETGVVCFGDEVVDAVAQFVEEGSHLFVLEETWLFGCRLREVADEGCDRVVACAVCVYETRLDVEIRGVTIFTFTRMEVQVEVADEAAALVFRVPDAEDLAVRMPDNVIAFAGWRDRGAVIASYFDEVQAEQCFEDGKHATN